MRLRTLPISTARRLCAAAAFAASALACSPALAADAAVQTPHLVQDPHYGDTLFYFYQDQYFSSITGLMVSQHFNRVSHHADEAEVLRGGLLLSFGLHKEAGEIFEQLIEKGATPPVRDRAWFYLAKIRYQRGLLAEAEAALGHIENNLPPELQEEQLLLKANVLMARGDYAGATVVLNAMTVAENGSPKTAASAALYARFNLGVALVKSGAPVPGTAMLDELGSLPTPPQATEEFRGLRDRANVALGFAALQDNQPEKAWAYLSRVRLSGMESNKALLGFGWASEASGDHKQALVPWTELSQREASDSAVLEARIALPYALAQMGANGQALERYTDALVTFERENVALDESIAAIRSGKLVDGLLERNSGDEMGWFWSIRELPDMPHASHLTGVLAQHQFQEAFKNYRDLLFLARNLQQWQDKLSVYSDMLDNRRKAYAERLPAVLAKARDIGLGDLARRATALSAELATAEEQADGVAFADAKERDLMERLNSVQAILKTAGTDPEMAAARERHRLAAGALTWQLAQQYPVRLWDAKHAAQTLEAGLAEAREHEASLARAQRDEPARFDQFAQRIAELGQRIQALTPRVAALSKEQQQAVQEMAVAELTRQKERLADYAIQAHFAVAQLYDRAHKGKDATHAPQ